MSKLKWLTNTRDPKNFSGDTLHRQEQEALEYLENKIIGRPKATERYSVEELEAMGLVGVYKED